jgi:hypothetical protein
MGNSQIRLPNELGSLSITQLKNHDLSGYCQVELFIDNKLSANEWLILAQRLTNVTFLKCYQKDGERYNAADELKILKIINGLSILNKFITPPYNISPPPSPWLTKILQDYQYSVRRCLAIDNSSAMLTTLDLHLAMMIEHLDLLTNGLSNHAPAASADFWQARFEKLNEYSSGLLKDRQLQSYFSTMESISLACMICACSCSIGLIAMVLHPIAMLLFGNIIYQALLPALLMTGASYVKFNDYQEQADKAQSLSDAFSASQKIGFCFFTPPPTQLPNRKEQFLSDAESCPTCASSTLPQAQVVGFPIAC